MLGAAIYIAPHLSEWLAVSCAVALFIVGCLLSRKE
jgi:hypothetical protein